MNRQEILLNLTLFVIIGSLIYLIYDSGDKPRTLDELSEAPIVVATGGANGDNDENGGDGEGADGASRADMPPGTETEYAMAADAQTTETPRGGSFGERDVFRALLTPTPTPAPPTPTPAPTPDIKQAIGMWKLTSVYQGKAYIEDVVKAEAQEEGAIWEMSVGDTMQVDVGGGVMKTVTLKEMNDSNPWNPDATFTLEGTTVEHNINLDTEPSTPAPKKAPAKK